jgi:hypothetical protein
LEQASGRYVLPVDADDHLFEDALRVAASFLRQECFPPLVYTDEDKLIAGRFRQPYFKPDWDPVLFANSAYIAHLNIVDREAALALGAYTDPETEGSPDWDLFVRFVTGGYLPKHLPEVLYSWRIHARSTADHCANKPCIPASQKAVLQRLLAAYPLRDKFEVRESPLSLSKADWHLNRRPSEAPRILSLQLSHRSGPGDPIKHASSLGTPDNRSFWVPIGSDLASVSALIRQHAAACDLVHLQGEDVLVEGTGWIWEAVGLFELYPDTVMVGGAVRTSKGIITAAGRYFGFGGVCGSPHQGSLFRDPGYFGQLWKQRSVSAVCSQFSVVKPRFLLDVFDAAPSGASLPFLGVWAGAHAARTGTRVIYTPFLSAISDLDWEILTGSEERQLFASLNSDLIPDRRYYSQHLSLRKPFALAKHAERAISHAAAL